MQIRLITFIVLTLLAGAMLPLWIAIWNLLFDPTGGSRSLIEVFFACFFAVDCLLLLFMVAYFLEHRIGGQETDESIREIQAAAKQRTD